MLTNADIQKLTQHLSTVFATKDDLKGFATKEDLKNFATKEDISDIKNDISKINTIIPTLATSAQLEQTKDALVEEMIEMFKLLAERKEEHKILFDHVSKMTLVCNNHEQRIRMLEEWELAA